MKWTALKHAFAVDPPGPAQPTPEQQSAVDWVCRFCIKYGLQTPAFFASEMFRPYNYIASQTGHFFSPAVKAVLPNDWHAEYKHLMTFLEQRGALEYMQQRIDELEDEDALAREAASEEQSNPSEENRNDGAGDDTPGRRS